MSVKNKKNYYKERFSQEDLAHWCITNPRETNPYYFNQK